MRIDRITPKSSFLSVEKDSAIIASEILKNERLKKYLVCNIKDVDPILDNYNITSKDESDLKEHIIKFAPKITVESPEFNYLIIKFNITDIPTDKLNCLLPYIIAYLEIIFTITNVSKDTNKVKIILEGLLILIAK